jgi:hypothetical protein
MILPEKLGYVALLCAIVGFWIPTLVFVTLGWLINIFWFMLAFLVATADILVGMTALFLASEWRTEQLEEWRSNIRKLPWREEP